MKAPCRAHSRGYRTRRERFSAPILGSSAGLFPTGYGREDFPSQTRASGTHAEDGCYACCRVRGLGRTQSVGARISLDSIRRTGLGSHPFPPHNRPLLRGGGGP
jgi:hypothetical protein